MESQDESKLRELRNHREQLEKEIRDIELRIKANLVVTYSGETVRFHSGSGAQIDIPKAGVDPLCGYLKQLVHGDNPYVFPKT